MNKKLHSLLAFKGMLFICLLVSIVVFISREFKNTAVLPLQPSSTILAGIPLRGAFLHLTDMHYDQYYKTNTKAKEFCHRKLSKNSKGAPKYGYLDTKCDSPVYLVNSTFSYLKKNLYNKIDFVIDTGDFMRHDRDDNLKTTFAEVVESYQNLLNYYNKTFGLEKIAVFPTIGNNDVLEHNSLSKNDKLFQKILPIWEKYGLDIEKEDFLVGGYYKHDMHNIKLRIISINTMYIFKKANLGKKKSSFCKADNSVGTIMLNWMSKQLQHAKEKNYKVMIIGHVPPLDKLNKKQYTKNCYHKFIDIVGEYSDIIQASFYGHNNKADISILVENKAVLSPKHAEKHKKHYQLKNYNEKTEIKKDEEILQVMSIAPSIVPSKPPGFRLFYYNFDDKKESVLVKDMHQYKALLKEANNNNKLEYKLEYSTKKDYLMKDFSVAEWEKHLKRNTKDAQNS